MLHPRDIGPAISRLRGGSLLLFDRLPDEQLELEALPGWTVADVFRHLADSDRGAVLGGHRWSSCRARTSTSSNGTTTPNLARLRERDRATLRHELEVWGRRLSRVVGLVPAPVARVPVPTAFGRLPMGWVACLRLYDEWVHRWDVARVIDDPEPPMDLPLHDLLAEFQLRALPAGPLHEVRRDAVVEIQVVDGPVGASISRGTGSGPTSRPLPPPRCAWTCPPCAWWPAIGSRGASWPTRVGSTWTTTPRVRRRPCWTCAGWCEPLAVCDRHP